MNLSKAPRTIYPEAQIGDMFPVICLRAAQEVLQAFHQLSTWNSDSDQEELLNVLTANTAGLSGKTSRPNMHVELCTDPN